MSFAVNLLVFSEGARIVENFSAIFVVAGVFFLGLRVEGFDVFLGKDLVGRRVKVFFAVDEDPFFQPNFFGEFEDVWVEHPAEFPMSLFALVWNYVIVVFDVGVCGLVFVVFVFWFFVFFWFWFWFFLCGNWFFLFVFGFVFFFFFCVVFV